MTKLRNAPAFKAKLPSTAEAMKMSESSMPALLALILLVSLPYAGGSICHLLGYFKSISVDGFGDFAAALAFLLVVMLAIRGAVLHGILSYLALSEELKRALASQAQARVTTD